MKNSKKLIALLLALMMTLSLVACGGGNTPAEAPAEEPAAEEPAETPAEEPAAAEEAYVPVPSDGAKYTVEVTADGWIKIDNEDGVTLGLSSRSGVKVIEVDGYAFKDMNQNGELDAYEDWRLSTEERAVNLVSLMSGEEMARILCHAGWGDFTTEPLTEDDGSYIFLKEGGRGGVTRNVPRGGGVHAQWANAIQEVAESCYYGIPAMISIDPSNISGLIECLALSSTMDPELAAEIGVETAKEYRAAGVTALLGPQVDLASPVMYRGGGTYGEDPKLTLDIATAYINGMQSSYAEDGTDLGWGSESVYCFVKHYAGAGATEGGRDDHGIFARYAVFPGDNLEAHLITYFDGAFNLPGKTESAGLMTQYSINIDGEGNRCFGGEWAGVYNTYTYGLLDYSGFDSLIIPDWCVYSNSGMWGAEALSSDAARIALGWERGAQLTDGTVTMEQVAEAYEILIENVGEEEAVAIISHAAYNYIILMMNLNMFDQPYSDSAYADSICYSESATEYALSTQRESVVMLKNDGTIAQKEASAEKPTVYVPYGGTNGFFVHGRRGLTPAGEVTYSPGMDLDILSNYFNIVTDTEVETNDAGAVTAIERASAEEIAACDYILVGMSDPYTSSYDSAYVSVNEYQAAYADGRVDVEDDYWYPPNLQFEQYTATNALEVSISGMPREDGTQQNRGYGGNTTETTAPNYADLEALEYAASVAGDIPVIVSVKMEHTAMVWSECEPLADVILVCYNKQYNEVVSEIVLGQTEPNGLLVAQQPASMEAVEAQVIDVPRDMECHVDANGNTYDFAFGMNWSGIINDERVATYSAEPLTKIQSFDYDAYEQANRG